MTDKASFDPVAEWQKLVSQWERQMNDLSNQFSGKEEFSQSMNQTTQLSLLAQKSFGEYMEKFLTTLHLPHESQIRDIAERLDRIEEKLDGLLAARSEGTPAERPPRTRRPPEAR